MASEVRKSTRSLVDEELNARVLKQPVDERLAEIMETASLKGMPLEERRKEANKPLFLDRYEKQTLESAKVEPAPNTMNTLRELFSVFESTMVFSS